MFQRNGRARHRAIQAAVEPLSPRVLLSATLVGHAVDIVGTEAGDRIVVAADPVFINVFDVSVNAETSQFSYSAATGLKISGLGGDDTILIDPSLDTMIQATTIDGGAGNDTIKSGFGSDAILGGDGDDSIDGGGGGDWISGGDGNDTLNGAAGFDTIDGGAGDDVINGGTGSDSLSDSAGHDIVHGGSGRDFGTFSDNGQIYGDASDDTLSGGPHTHIFGGGGNDTLHGRAVWGGAGNDTITGTAMSDTLRGEAGNDSIHGADGNDLILGGNGADQLFGDNGGDALFGGSMSDTLHGGAGNDNLYGDDGPKDKDHSDDGNDSGFGEAGQDWFEPTHKWAVTDADPKQDSGAQIKLAQDPAYGSTLYLGSASMTINASISTDDFTDLNGNWTTNIGSGNLVAAPPDPIKFLGPAGLLAMGSYDAGTNTILPSALTTSQRKALRPMILALPPNWKLGAMSTARDDVIWYRVTGSAIAPDPSNQGATGTISFTGNRVINGGQLAVGIPNTAPTKTIADAPGASDGVEFYYRYLAVKRGTILIGSSDDSDGALYWPLDTKQLALPSRGVVRIAGDNVLHPLGRSFDTNWSDLSKDTRGILLQDGVIWLPADGLPSFTSTS